MFHPPGECPVCGDDVPRGRKSCPHCGADEKTGWDEEDDSGAGLDLPDAEFNYENFVENEFGGSPKPRNLHFVWWITGIVLILLLLGGYAIL